MLDLYSQQSRFQLAANPGLTPLNNGTYGQTVAPGHMDGGAPASTVARDLAANFDYFRTPGSPFISRDSLAEVANRPLIGDRFHDRMTTLARDVLDHPGMGSALDGMTNNGREDGLISQGDVSAAIEHFDAQEAPNTTVRVINLTGPFNGALQQQRLDQQQPQQYVGQLAWEPVQPIGGAPSTGHLGNATDAELSRELGNNFDYFKPNANDKICQQSLCEVANRPMSGNPVDDRMTRLALEILSRPALNRQLDASLPGDVNPDGLIGRDTVEFLSKKPATSYQPSAQQQLFFRQDAWQSPQYGQPASIGQPSSYGGAQANQAYAGTNPYANDSKEELSNRLLSHFSALEDPNAPGFITDKSLGAVAGGYHLDGQPATLDEVNLAKALQDRGGLFKALDEGQSGIFDGKISRQDLGEASDKYRNMNDAELLGALKEKFKQLWDKDDYVSFDGLKKAAVELPPSDRSKLAAELLRRPGLMKEVDIGTNNNGGRGWEDERFDMDNVDYVRNEKTSRSNA